MRDHIECEPIVVHGTAWSSSWKGGLPATITVIQPSLFAEGAPGRGNAWIQIILPSDVAESFRPRYEITIKIP